MKDKILLVEDEESIREYMCDLLTGYGYDVIEADNGEKALSLFFEQHFDLVITDMALPNKNGAEIMSAIRQMNHGIGIVAVSGKMSASDLIKDANKEGADAIIQKPFTAKEFLTTIRNCSEKFCL